MAEPSIQEIDDRQVRWDYASATVRYRGHGRIGAATSAPAWRIARLTFDSQGRHITTEFAGGSAEYDQIWDDRATLSFS